MDKEKIALIVKGYLWKEKRNTVFTALFLCFVVMFLFIGNQLFQNVRLANKMNAEALEGRQHVTYYGITEKKFKKIKKCPFVSLAGQSISIGHTQDGTGFSCVDENYRKLSATAADKNIKHLMEGRWAENEDEIVFTKNYMEYYGLRLGDQVTVDLTSTDSGTGDLLFKIPEVLFTIAGVIENPVGFQDRKMGYVSENFGLSVIEKYHEKVNVNAFVLFDEEDNISKKIDLLNSYLGFDEERLQNLVIRENSMLATAVGKDGDLSRQGIAMNFIVWLVSAMVVYHIFYSRFFAKKRDFANLRKIGFQAKDLFHIMGTEFLILGLLGFAIGAPAGIFVNKIIYREMLKVFIKEYDAGSLVLPDVSLYSIGKAVVVFFLILFPGFAMVLFSLKKDVPANFMRNQRKGTGKLVLSLVIVFLSAVLVSLLSVQDNESGNGILYVKTYVPADLQITKGSLMEGMMGMETVQEIGDKEIKEMKEDPDIITVQDFKVNYDRSVFLCEEISKLNRESSYYEFFTENKQKIDGKKQGLYNLVLAAADNLKALEPSYGGNGGAIMEEGLADALNLQIGDTFSLYDEQIMSGSKEGVKSVSVTLIGTRADMVLSENHLGPNVLILDQETAEIFSGKLSRQVVNIWVKDGKEDAVISRLNHMSELDGCSLHSAKQEMQEFLDSDRNQAALHNFFMVLLALIGMITYFNTVFENTINRKNDIMIMHKIGISRREMYSMSLKEGSKNGIAVIVVLGILQLLFCMKQKEVFVSFFLIDAGTAAVCIIFPVITMYGMLRRDFFQNIPMLRQWYIVIAPVIMITAILMSCSKKEIKKDNEVSVKNTKNEYVYHPTFQDVNINMDSISGVCRKGETIYILAAKNTESKKYGSKQSQYLLRCAEDGSDLQQTRLKELKGNETVIAFAADDQNQLRLLTQQYEYKEKTQESRQAFSIYTLNEKGKIKDVITLKPKPSEYGQEYFYRNSRNTVIFSNGSLYTAIVGKIYTFDKKGKEGRTYETEGIIDGFIRTAKGEIYIYGSVGNKYGVRKFDPETGNFGDMISFKEYQIDEARMYAGEGNTVYADDQNNIYAVDLLSGELKIEFNWLNNNIDGNTIRPPRKLTQFDKFHKK